MWYKLSDLFDLQMGKTPSRNNPNYWNSKDYLWVSISDMSGYDKYVSSAKEYISERAVKESGIKTIPANTVIMSFKLSIGKTAITTESIFSNEAIMAFIDKKTTAIDPEYIFYLFSGKDWDEGSNKAVMGKTLNKVTLSNTEVDIPSLDIQKERVDKLNKISTLIADKKQQLNQLDELVKARFVEMFKDCIESVKLEQVVTSIKTGKLDANVEKKDGKYPFFTCDAIPKRIDDYAFDAEAILISGNGSRVGHVHYYKGKFNAYQRTYVLSDFRHDIDLSYLKTYLENELRPYIARNKKGSAVPYITLPMLQNFKLPFPPLEKQKEFSNFVTQIDKSKFALQNSIKSLMNLWYNIN